MASGISTAAGPTSAPSIMVIGSLNVDLVTYTPRIPDAGETMSATSFRTGLGGKGANQAVACAKLSRGRPAPGGAAADAAADVAVYMVGAVGDDVYGPQMTAGLRKAGVDASGVVVRPGTSTGVAVILVDETSGDNRILLTAGANGTVSADAFAHGLSASLAQPLPLPAMVILQLEIPLATVLQILETAHRQGVPVLLNAAPAQRLPDPAYYRYITHLVVNETEASILSGRTVTEASSVDDLAQVVTHFLGLGAAHVIITLGGRGVFWATPDHGELVPAAKISVVDTTAAGDTFIGAYALALVRGQSVAAAVQRANRAAAVTVSRQGAQESIPWADEVE